MFLLFDSILLNVASIVIALVGAVYMYSIWPYDYWEKKGVPFIKPFPFFGTIKGFAFRQQSFADMINEQYRELSAHKMGGLFSGRQPSLMIRDPELLKTMLVKDFDHFTDRRQVTASDKDVLMSKVLINLTGQRWKEMRATLSPTFTSGKMKKMFYLMRECGDQLVKFFEAPAQKDEMLEMKDSLSRFTNDVIASTAFGIQCNALGDPDSNFHKMGKSLLTSGGRTLQLTLMIIFPKLAAKLGITFMQKETTEFFRTLVRDTISYREKENVVRPDMIHLLMLAKKGQLTDDDLEDFEHLGSNGTTTEAKKALLDDDDVVAQAVIFFLAGFETVSTAMSFVVYELAVNPDVQQRLMEEIDDTLAECGGNVTYDAISKMTYLDMVISETLRKYPPAVATDRKCVKEYTIPGTTVTLDEGSFIVVPIYGFHHDPKYFPNPEKFDPERFNQENKDKIVPYSYLPFSVGPRNCIGMRFALLEMKIGLVAMLSSYEMQVCEKTQIPLKFTKKSFQMTGENGIWLKVKMRKNKAAS